MSLVWLRHTEHGGYWEVPEDAASGWGRRGWERVDPPTEDQLLAQEAGTSPFNPAEHTVAEVQKYLEEHPNEADRVLAAERGSEHPRKALTE